MESSVRCTRWRNTDWHPLLLFCTGVWANDSDKLVFQTSFCRFDSFVDSMGKCRNILVLGAGNNAGMVWGLVVEFKKMLPVIGEQNPVFRNCKGQNFIVRDFHVCLSGVFCGQNIVAKFAQDFDDAQPEIFVGIDFCHLSIGFVFPNLVFDFRFVVLKIMPSILQIAQAQSRVISQLLILGNAQLPLPDEQPNRYAGIFDASFAPANARRFFNSRKNARQLGRDPMYQLGLFGFCQFREKGFRFLQGGHFSIVYGKPTSKLVVLVQLFGKNRDCQGHFSIMLARKMMMRRDGRRMESSVRFIGQ